MIVSLDEVKAYCNITNNSKDSSIIDEINGFTEFVIEYCNNNSFFDRNVCYQGNAVFNQDKTITISGSFYDLFFRNGITINIKNSILNNGLFSVSNVNNGIITVVETLENETIVDCQIIKIIIPKPIINTLKDLIKNSLSPGVKSKTLGDKSMTYDDKVINPYKILNQYRIIRTA